MHELSVCRNLVRQITAVTDNHQANAVSLIHLQIGPLSGVEAELIKQSFPFVSHGTVAEGAELEIEILPVRIKCLACHTESVVEVNRLICQHCGDSRTRLLSGDELLLNKITLTQS